MIHFSEFSGIGGFDLAAEWTGWKNYLSCEINPFGNKVLEHYWPAAYHHHDITTLTYDTINSELSKRFGPAWRNDDIIISGGFPCQPYSTAGKRLGKEDHRHLWPQMLRTIREIEPTWVVGENVRGLTNWNGGLVFNEVWSDLEALGYEVLPFLLPACAVDAPHRRDRIWIVAYSDSKRYGGRRYANGQLEEGAIHQDQQSQWDGVRSEDSTRGKVVANAGSNGRKRAQETEGIDGEGAGKGMGKRYEPDSQSNAGASTHADQFDGDLSGFRTSEVSQLETSGIRQNPSTDTNSKQRREGRLHAPERETAERYTGAFDPRHGRGTWKDFPTQSPVCSGNDGISERLDRSAILEATGARSDKGSHFHRWRSESIKAAGNAIVPQVAYQIFQAIQQFHDCTL